MMNYTLLFLICIFVSDGYVEGFTGDTNTSLTIVYFVFAFGNWIAPPIVSWIGPKKTLVSGKY